MVGGGTAKPSFWISQACPMGISLVLRTDAVVEKRLGGWRND